MLKAVVTGANGQLGRELTAGALAGWQVTPLARDALDIGDARAVAVLLEQLQPDLVVNAAAYTAVDRAESEPELARRVNTEGPGNLAAACAAHGSRLLHISTDFVFDGRASVPLAPDAATAPLGVYGQTKRDGELAVMATLPDALIVRTGWVYSCFGSNFVKTMLRLMAGRDTLTVVADQVGTPTWAAGLADALWAFAGQPALRGIYHWSDAGVCSWYDFAVAVAEEGLARGLLPKPVAVRPISVRDYPTPARRPAYSVLDKSATWAVVDAPVRHWRAALRLMLDELKGDGI